MHEANISIEDRSLYLRKIIHFDMDAFYAAVEIRDNPELAHKAVVIGGSPQSRAVVCTANYKARTFGIRSAMPCSQAYRLCPDAIFMSPNFTKYKDVSLRIREIFQDYSEIIEPLSLDEAFIDVSKQARYASTIAKEIQNRIWQDLKLTGSAGVAPNKMIAKIASDFRKPFGITVIQPHEVKKFIAKLPLRTIPGIGPASQERLQKFGYELCHDIWPKSVSDLCLELGENMGSWVYWRSRGIDHRQVEASRERKSIGLERTFPVDIINLQEIKQILKLQIDELISILNKKKTWARTWTLKVKYFDFEQCTRSTSNDIPNDGSDEALQSLYGILLDKTEAGQKKIRLLGVAASNLQDSDVDLNSLDNFSLEQKTY